MPPETVAYLWQRRIESVDNTHKVLQHTMENQGRLWLTVSKGIPVRSGIPACPSGGVFAYSNLRDRLSYSQRWLGRVATPRISLVIPAYNEARLLPRLLDSVDIARERLATSGATVEVIVADNVSTDTTAQVAADRGCRVVTVTTRTIAAVRNGGAQAATGEILAFVDADSRVHPDTFLAIDHVLQSDRVVGGSTGCTMERWSLGLAVTFAVMLPALWLTGLDTGVVFCRRPDFERLDGYDESYAAAEDVIWLWKLKRDGATRRQRLVRLRHAKVVASARKFDEHGDWHYFRFVVAAPRFFLSGGRLSAFWTRYWYRPDR